MKIGIYQHFNGNKYKVLGVAKHSETLEDFVVYQSLSEGKELWARPLKMFLEEVETKPRSDRSRRESQRYTTGVNGKKIPRFKYIGK